MQSAIDFVDQLRRRLLVAVQSVTTDNGSEFGADFTRHLHDLGIRHQHIPPRCPQPNGKVERGRRTDGDEALPASLSEAHGNFDSLCTSGSTSTTHAPPIWL
jgi:transposase InsO family protein